MKALSDWLLKLGVSFAVHLQATHTGFVSENIAIVAGRNTLKSSFCSMLAHHFSRLVPVHTKTSIKPISFGGYQSIIYPPSLLYFGI